MFFFGRDILTMMTRWSMVPPDKKMVPPDNMVSTVNTVSRWANPLLLIDLAHWSKFLKYAILFRMR